MSQIFTPDKKLSKDYSEVYEVLDTYYKEQELNRKEVLERFTKEDDRAIWTNPLHYSELKQKNGNYKLITDYYEEDRTKSAEKVIIQEFGKRKWNNAIGINNNDKISGFVVAAYFGNHEFDKAAKIVLERDKNLPKWNHSLKLDLIKCIRNYRIAKGLPSAISLIDSLKKEYDTEIISYFWTSTPYRVAYTIENSFHEKWTNEEIIGETKTDLSYLIKTYPNDPFCSYGHYLLGNSIDAIKCNPMTRIVDILYYSIGMDIVDNLFTKYREDASVRKDLFYSLKRISNKTDIAEINEAISHFNKYIEQFKDSQYADDAAFWIGWLNMLTHNKKDAIYWFRKTNSLGDKKHYWKSLSYKSKQIDKFSEKLILSDLENDFIPSHSRVKNNNNKTSISFYHYYHVQAFERLRFKEKIKFLNQNSLNSDKLFFAFMQKNIYLGKYDEANRLFNELKKHPRKFLNLINPEIKNKLNDLEELVNKYIELIEENDLELFIIKILEVKNKLDNPKLALACLKKVRDKKKWKVKRDYLDYLIIKIYSDISRFDVESEVRKFEINHPQSNFLDDVLAELALLQLFKLKKPEEGIKTVKKIVDNHANDNASDNALNWLGKYYFDECVRDASWGSDLLSCQQSLKVNGLIDDNYWFSTYKNVSKYRLEKTKEIIQRYVPRDFYDEKSIAYRNFLRDLY